MQRMQIVWRSCLLLIILVGVCGPARRAAASEPLPAGPGGDETAISAIEDPIGGPEATGCGGASPATSNAAYEQRVIDLVNAERKANNLPPLKRRSSLDQAARYHSADLGQDNYWDHNSYDRLNGSLSYVCAWNQRVSSYYSNYNYMAENIAGGYATPEAVVAAWMGSSGHRQNILSAENWEIGVGYVESGGTYGRYWTQDFGRRSGVYPLVIDREAAVTEDAMVEVYIYGNWQEMRLRNDNGAWSEWMPFSRQFERSLPASAGEHTISAELRSGATTASAADAIVYQPSAQPAELGNLPDRLHFTYSLVEAFSSPNAALLTPQNIASGESLNWTLTASGNWFSAGPLAGVSPASFSITPTLGMLQIPGTYTGLITVTVTQPAGTVNSPHVIQLEMTVMDGPIQRMYLPGMIN